MTERTTISRGRAIGAIAALGAAAIGYSYARANETPNGSPILRVREAANGQWFFPAASDTSEPYGLYTEVRKSANPHTEVTDDGRTVNQLILNGPGELGIDFRLSMKYRWHRVGQGTVRGALWFNDLPTGTELYFADATDRVKEVIRVGGGGFAGGVLPDADNAEIRARIKRPAGNFSPIKVNIGNVSEADAQRTLDSHIRDLADSFNLPKQASLKINPEPGVPVPEGYSVPHVNITDVSARPELHNKWFLPTNARGISWNDAVYMMIKKQPVGGRFVSHDTLGFMGLESNAGSDGLFRLALQIDPARIDYYTYDGGVKVPGAEPRVLFGSHPNQAGTRFSLMNKDWSAPLKDTAGKELSVALPPATWIYRRALLLPRIKSELHLQVQFANLSEPGWVELRFGPKLPNDVYLPEDLIDGKVGALTGSDLVPTGFRTLLPHSDGGSIYVPNQR